MILQSHFKGSIHSIILSLLKESDELYGYEICQIVATRTNGSITLTEGAIYPSLHRLEKEGYINSRKEHVKGRWRKYYCITAKGEKEYLRQLNSLSSLYRSLGLIFGKNIIS